MRKPEVTTKQDRSANGFTLIELLVVIAVIGILAGLLLPVLSKAKQRAKGINCVSNMKQLTTAWTLYAGDFNDLLVTNTCDANTNSWAAGWLDWSDPADTDNTNVFNIMSPQGLLWPYTKSLGIYVCPSDPSTVDINGTTYSRVRSVSMNLRMNGGEYPAAPLAQFNNPNKLSAIRNPGPSMAFVFIDERADSINDGFFVVNMLDANAWGPYGNTPANYHNDCGTVSFADAHVETHKWLDPRTKTPMIPRTVAGILYQSDNPDTLWLRQHCTALQ